MGGERGIWLFDVCQDRFSDVACGCNDRIDTACSAMAVSCERSYSATTVWLILCPIAHSSVARRRTPLQVQRSGDIGSPRSLGLTSDSKSSNSVGSVAVSALRPHPCAESDRGPPTMR